jgi:hypothetical protein
MKTLVRDLKLGDGMTIPMGTKVESVTFDGQTTVALVALEGRTFPVRIHCARLGGLVSGFKKVPGLKALEGYSDKGICPTITGQKVEPDGFGSDGSPSWLLIAGVL